MVQLSGKRSNAVVKDKAEKNRKDNAQLSFDSWDNLWNLVYLATEALIDSTEFIGAIQINLSTYLSIYVTVWQELSSVSAPINAK